MKLKRESSDVENISTLVFNMARVPFVGILTCILYLWSRDEYEEYAVKFFGSFNSSIKGWFQSAFPVNNAYQWMIPVWKDCIQYLPASTYEVTNRFLRWLMEMLSPDYHQPHFDTDDRYQKVATELREYILSDESPEALKEVWREVHES